jgi:benzaldehyde dehydrogenase (NAD)
VPGGKETGEALVRDPNVNVIAFTGSTAGGRAVARLAAEYLKRVHLELGGNSAMIVMDDADLEKVASAGSFGSFFHQGQVCMATSRHLVDRKVAGQYSELLAAHANNLPVGNPATGEVALGPLIDERQRDRIHGVVTSSVEAGARLLAGGTFEGLFYKPTVLGPVAPIVPFDTAEEAARLAAGTPYGLSVSICTRDVMRGLALAGRIPSGLVHINDQTIHDEANIPFGGVKESGSGSRLGGAKANLEAFTDLQWVTIRGDVPGYPF